MRCASLLVASLALSVHLTHAAPLAGPLGDIFKGISAERDLAPATSEVGAARNLVAPPTQPVPAQDGVTLAFRSPYESGSLSRLPMSPSRGPVHSLAAQVAPELSFSPRIDTLFLSYSPFYRESSDHFRLPQEFVHIPSPWLAGVYDRLLSTPSVRRKSDFNRDEIPIPASIAASFASHGRRFYYSRADAYIVRIPPEWLGLADASAPQEVLVRYHKELRWLPGPARNVISFWSTADAGSKLALLGIFRITKHGFDSVMGAFPGVERFAVETRAATRPVLHMELFLVRKRLPGPAT